jgi:hypothetical protein
MQKKVCYLVMKLGKDEIELEEDISMEEEEMKSLKA